ncbi:MAG: GNAT family N-acetyltransferase [Anaerolineales bacterium]|jgi:FemAB-related protein (PEP-CTERM system-associated)|nr:GNAT family N-acetyltransferase [Anaerolineales bacterium]
MLLRPLTPDEPANWPDSLTHPATFTALDAWTGLARTIYRYPGYRFETEEEGAVTGLLALTHVKHPLFGNFLTTAPFGSYGGFAFTDAEARRLLLEAAQTLAADLGVDYVNLRFAAADPSPPPGWVQQPVYQTYLVDLTPDAETLLETFSSNHRNHVRKSLKKGFSVKFGGPDLLDDAYEALARSMHELGSPYHSKTYLKTMAGLQGDALEFGVLYAPDGKLAGAGVFIQHGQSVTNLHANILRAYRSDYAGEFLYWQALTRYAGRGLKTFDLGRSLAGSGNETFKMKWNPRRQELAYWYWLKPGAELPALNQKNPKFQFAIWLWKRLPAFIIRPLGPFLIKGLA